jgi:hypothetical protein
MIEKCEGLGKQFLDGQKDNIRVDIRLKNDWIMCVNEFMGLHMRSNVCIKRLSKIGAKLIKHELKQ